MEDLRKYVTLNEKGELEFNTDLFKADLDRERNQASETARTNAEKKLRASIESEVRSKIEEEAKLTAEEKLEQERKAFLEEKKRYNAERIKNVYRDSKLFNEAELEVYGNLITEDFDKSLEIANKLVESRKTYNAEYEKSFNEKLQQGLPRTNGGQTNSNESSVAKIAKSYSQNNKNDIVDL
jgi:hypothetical protein